MSFLSSTMLAGLFAMIVPILIHLLQKRRVVDIPFSTLRFLKKVSAKTVRSARVENLLLLILRCAVLGLVALAAARPVLSGLAAKFAGGQVPRVIALVIYQSYSMSYRVGDKNRLDLAKEMAGAVLDQCKPGDSVAIIGATDRARGFIPEPTVEIEVARKALDSVQMTEGASSFAAAMRAAFQAVSRRDNGKRQIFVFTDSQPRSWKFEPESVISADWKNAEIELIVAHTDAVQGANIALLGVEFSSMFVSPGSVVRGMASVANFSEARVEQLLELRVGDEVLADRAVEAEAGQNVSIPFEFQVPSGAAGPALAGVVSLSGDRITMDDKRYFALSMAQPAKVLCVEAGDGPEKVRPGFFLRKAFAAGTTGATVKTVPPVELDELNVDPYSAVFVLGVSALSDRASVRLAKYLEAGGTVAVFAGDAMSAQAWERVEWMPAKIHDPVEFPAGRIQSKLLEPQHPLFVSWDSKTPFPALGQRKAFKLEQRKGARGLISIGDDIPFLLLGTAGQGRVIIVNASADLAWGNFPVSPVFLPLLQEIGRLANVRTGSDKAVLVGEPVAVPRSLPRDAPFIVSAPSSETTVAAIGSPLLDQAPQSGIYDVKNQQNEVVHRFAVNVDGTEGDLRLNDPEQLLQRITHEDLKGSEELAQWLATSRGASPLWPLVLVLAVFVFIIETIYSNALALRRAAGEDGQIMTGRLNRRRFGQRRAGQSAVAGAGQSEGGQP